MPSRIAVATVALLSLVTLPALAENWPQFRGPNAAGLPEGTHLATNWGPNENIAWKVDLPGAAWSQPIAWGDRIYLTTAVTEDQSMPAVGQAGGGRRAGSRSEATTPKAAADDHPETKADSKADKPRERSGRGNPHGSVGQSDKVFQWHVLCLDRKTGKVLWDQTAHEGKPTLPIHRTNTYASETPVTDGERVYAYFGMTGLYCYDMDGKLLWKKDLGNFPMMFGWGTGSSPALYEDRLYIQCDNERESFLVALDKRSGDELWRVEREEKSNWSTPFIWKNKARTELVTAGGRRMRGYDPADGKLLWEMAGVRGRCSATPVASDELLYLGVGGGPGGLGPLVAVKAGASGDISIGKEETSNAGVAWKIQRSGPPMASPLLYENCLYILDQGGGIVGCYDAATGKEHYRQRIDGARSFTSSPWGYDGKVFCLDEDGQTFVLAPGPELKVLDINKLDDTFWSSVAVAGDLLLLRGVDALYAIGPKAN